MKKQDEKALDKITDKVLAHKPSQPDFLPLNRQLMLIEHEVDGEIVAQRPHDGYINATDLCKKSGKLFGDYRRLSATNEFLDILEADMGIPITELIQILKGGLEPKLQGTWVHPKVAIHLAQWLSPKFAVQVSKWVHDWMVGVSSGQMPLHVKRYLQNRAKIPHTHFSMLNEMYLHLIAPLEETGYLLPDRMVPDISTGRMFSDFLRSQGVDPDRCPEYDHAFMDNKRPTVRARLYPIEFLPMFRNYFHSKWLPQKALRYFSERDQKSIPHIRHVLKGLPAPKDED